MNYCAKCGETVKLKIPAGDTLRRYCCDACGAIHYQNPRVIAGTLTVKDNRILMCKRAIEPRKGLWTLPAGFMENGETLGQAAGRETLEETNVQVRVQSLLALFSLPHINQVYVFLRAEVVSGTPSATAESEQAVMVHPDEIPWEKIAFPTVRRALEYHLEDLKAGRQPARPRVENVYWSRDGKPQIRFEPGLGS